MAVKGGRVIVNCLKRYGRVIAGDDNKSRGAVGVLGMRAAGRVGRCVSEVTICLPGGAEERGGDGQDGVQSADG